ncbi:MAG TPA: Calx-beta domain-containing protein [Verrucomicrobiota bacterium]|nr:Calx-beta domain-containing protein [Verrucomicrobiota bacterium]HQB15133.1 Calx-beta domain-containing protein [Verrucomicrobiota bacterium]
MKTVSLTKRFSLGGLAVGLGLLCLASTLQAVPYASGVVRNGNTVTFILNHDAEGLVVLRDGGNPVYPGTAAGELSFDMTGYTSYQIIVTGNTAVGWAQYVPDGNDRNIEYPFGVSINKNPASPNFGKVYVSSARVGTTALGRVCGDGIYLLRADGVEIDFKDGGRTWIGDSAPYRSTIGPDDHLYVADLSNHVVFEFNDDLSAVTQLIDGSNRTYGPAGAANNADQYVHSVWVTGTQAGGDRKIYLVNGNYYDVARKGLIMYDLGSNATATPDDKGTQLIGPQFYTYYPYDVAQDSEGNWYLNQYRASTGQAPAIDKFNGSIIPNQTPIWSTGRDYTYTWGLDIYEPGKLAAVGQASGGKVYIFSMNTGEFLESFTAGSAPRELAFDAAGNIVTVDNAVEFVRFWSPGGYTIAITSWDGTKAAFELVKAANEVSVTATTPEAAEAGPVNGVFTITRAGLASEPLTVNYTLSGTAVNGEDYVQLSGTAVIPANANSVDVVVTPIDDAIPELPETVILTLAASDDYGIMPPSSATVVILDNETPELRVVSLSTNVYERLSGDYATLVIQRYGDTNLFLQVDESNLTFSGTAVKDVDYQVDPYYAAFPLYLEPGAVSARVQIIYPLDNDVVDGARTVTVGMQAGSGFTAATNTVTTTIVDDEWGPETVVFRETFDTPASANNWTVFFADTNAVSPVMDGTVEFGQDYSWFGIPPAPGATDTYGLYLQANKDGVPAAAAINVYPKGKVFSGNYALRFDMYMIVGQAATTEYTLFGINHSGTKTNWFRNSAGGVPAGWTFDGLFYGVESDAAALGDYVLYSAPTTAGNNPTPLTPGRNASTLAQVFKAPPFAYAGAPANGNAPESPSWVDVEVSQINGVVTLRMNKVVIFSYTNATPYTSGNIMLGYTDAYDSIGSPFAGVVFDNVRVVQFPATSRPAITGIVVTGGNVEITFTGETSDAAGAFGLQAAGTVTGAYGDVTATITVVSPGVFKAVRAVAGSEQYYRIKRL